MVVNLAEAASTQYCRWLGTAAADNVDMKDVGTLLGVDSDHWDLVVLDLHIDGGYQSITGWATPRAEAGYEDRKRKLEETGTLEVTRVVYHHEEPHGHADTNPPAAPTSPITWASELIAFGFKRLHVRLIDVQDDLRHLVNGIHEVDSIVD